MSATVSVTEIDFGQSDANQPGAGMGAVSRSDARLLESAVFLDGRGGHCVAPPVLCGFVVGTWSNPHRPKRVGIQKLIRKLDIKEWVLTLREFNNRPFAPRVSNTILPPV